jgi:tRNA(Ile)-lysidine synthase
MLVPFETTIRETLARRTMLEAPSSVVLAVSGGPDSMALLHAIVRIRAATSPDLRLIVAHLDHCLRGVESTEDAAFTAAAADRLGLKCIVERDDVAACARDARRNLEAVARERRYAFLTRVALELGARRVATGHTASDQAETVLMQLSRGAGVDGLAGIAPSRPLADGVLLIRPLLDVSRRDVLAYCANREIPYRVDATNVDPELTRALVRHEIIPRLERTSPGCATNIARAASLAADDREYFAEIVDRTLRVWGVAESGPVALPAAEVAMLPPAIRRRILREAVRRSRGDLRRLTAGHVQILERLAERSHGTAELPYGVRARREGDSLILDCAPGKAVEKAPGGSYNR